MAYLTDGYYSDAAAYAPADARVTFIRNTYAHLLGAILAFAGLLYALLSLPGINNFMLQFFGTGRMAWLVIIVLFIAVSYVAHKWAESEASQGLQYLGLGLYVVIEAIIFLPLLWMATRIPQFANAHIVENAVLLTALTFGGLTAAVFITKQDFSFLRTALMVGGFLALGLVVASLIFGFSLGLVFCLFMIALACGYIIYDTSNVLHHYRTTQHVAAALALFSSVALLFYYILRVLMFSTSSDD